MTFENELRAQEIITIYESDYLTHELAKKIAFMQWGGTKPEDFNSIRQKIYSNKRDSDCFYIIALNSNDDVIGGLSCVKNQKNEKRWYYGDLAVKSEYRRMKIATRMLKTAIQKISEMGGDTICCYVDPSNKTSIKFQKSLDFIEKPTLPFNLITVDGDIMFELNIEQRFNVIPATENEAQFVFWFYAQNRKTLHSNYISRDEWREILSKDDPDEKNFLVCKGAIPVAFLRLNGLNNKDIAWISMLVVSDKFHRQGIGTFAVQFAEEYVISKAFTKMELWTQEDNLTAQALYKKCGYEVAFVKDDVYNDGTTGKSYRLEKILKVRV